nr:AAA family ATPase [Bradyrhizobium sp. URHD0069]
MLQILIEKAGDVSSPTDFIDEIVSAWDQRQAVGQPARNSRIRLVPFDKIKLGRRRRDLVKGIFPREGLSIIWGPPKCGKSFWLFDCMMHVSMGWPYRDRRVHQGPVVYCAFEGQSGFEARVEAFRLHHFKETPLKPVPFYLQPVTIDLVRDHAALIKVIRETLGKTAPVAVALDTLNRSLRGSESSDEDMSAYVGAADAVRDAFKCAVPIVHHCGIDGTRPRGHTSLTGAADAQLAVRLDSNDNIVVKVEAAKDSAAGTTLTSKLHFIKVGTDEDGDAITSGVVVAADQDDDADNSKDRPRLSPKTVAALRALHNCIAEIGSQPPAGSRAPQASRGVTLDQWRDELLKAALINRKGSHREEFKRIRVTLQNAAIIGIYEDFVWRVT